MPNLSSILTGVVTSAVKQHISGGNQRPQQPPPNGSGSSSSGYQPAGQNTGGYPQQPTGGGSGYDPYAQQPPPQQQPSGYQPNSDMYGGPGYPQGPGYPSQGAGYPSQGGGYPPQGPGYPSQGSSYPAQMPGYPGGQQPSAYSPYPLESSGQGYPPQGPPSHGYGGHGQSQYPPPSQPQYPSQGGGVYPTMAMDSVAQQFHGPAYGGQPANAPTMNANPSLRPTPQFNANADAEALRKAMKGFGTNNAQVIRVICGRTNWERQEMNRAFKVMYGKDLIKDLKSELSGDFEDLILATIEPPAIYDAKQLHKAMAGLGTKESVLIEIMCSRTNAQIHAVKMAYKQLYGKDLERELIGETSGSFKRLLTSLCAGGRDESMRTDPMRANQDARNLYRAGEQRLGTDESTFNSILASQNFAQLQLVFQEYQKVSKHSIEQAINAEFSGDIRDGLLAIVKVIKNRPAFFAELIYNAMRGFGTRDNDLIRLVVTRAEIDMRDIRNEYHRMYKTSLENAIAGDCSGNYKEALIALVKGNY